jgi:hypothetical protein
MREEARPDGGVAELSGTTTALGRVLTGIGAVLLPVVTLVVVSVLIGALTSRTESAGRTLDLGGYLGFAGAAVVVCGLVGVAGNGLSRQPGAARGGIVLGWLVLGASVLLLVAFSFLPSAPPWVSWRAFRSFISLLGTPFVFAVAMTAYTIGFAVRDPRRRWPIVLALSIVPGLVIALYGVTDPMSR